GASNLVQVTGQLHVYPDEKAAAKDSGGWALRRQLGIPIEILNHDQIRSLEPQVGPHYRLGYFLPDQGMVVNPLRQAQVLAAGLAARGATFVRDEITNLQIDGRHVKGVMSGQNTYLADHVVVCAGAWSARLLKGLGCPIPLETQRGYNLTLADSGITLRRPVVAADRKIFATSMEFGLRLAGTVEFGGLTRAPTMRRATLLQQYSQSLFPDLNAAAQATSWMGHRPCLPDSLPILGPAPSLSGLWLNFGHGHLGLTM